MTCHHVKPMVWCSPCLTLPQLCQCRGDSRLHHGTMLLYRLQQSIPGTAGQVGVHAPNARHQALQYCCAVQGMWHGKQRAQCHEALGERRVGSNSTAEGGTQCSRVRDNCVHGGNSGARAEECGGQRERVAPKAVARG